MNPAEIIKKKALELGFDKVGITSTEEFDLLQFFEKRFSRGYHAQMNFLKKSLKERLTPQLYLPWAKSIICVGKNYYKRAKGSIPFARFALDVDYHITIGEGLSKLCEFIEKNWAGQTKLCVDTSPVLEKHLAARAGLGWIGKNTLLISRDFGPWLHLGEIFTEIELTPDNPTASYCGRCQRCIKACPTGAIVEPYMLDARKCIAYLTLSYKGIISPEICCMMGDKIFGCDICLEVCPWTRFAKGEEIKTEFDIMSLAKLSQSRFEEIFDKTPVARRGYTQFLRNIAVALGNTKNRDAIPLLKNLINSPFDVVREHSKWALSNLE
jgi:epoxyqueuosine reductase